MSGWISVEALELDVVDSDGAIREAVRARVATARPAACS
jgi:hypothetical protein